MAKKVTLEQIALQCGVTKGLVSRALANKYNVSDEMTYKIKQKALELGYDFSKLKFNRNVKRKILLLCPSRLFFKENFWQEIIKSISTTLGKSTIVIEYFIYEENGDLKSLENGLKNNDYSAFILIHYNNPEITNLICKKNVPIIIVDPKSICLEATQIKFSNYDSSYFATKYLIENGHKQIAFYGADSHSTSFRERHEGFLACINDNKHIKHEEVIFDNVNKYYADDNALKNLIKTFNPTALVCANDIIAINSYRVINALGLKVPEDISVIGFDNVTNSETCHPKLTTFNIPRVELGREVAEYTIHAIENKKLQYSQIVIRCEFVERDSVKKR